MCAFIKKEILSVIFLLVFVSGNPTFVEKIILNYICNLKICKNRMTNFFFCVMIGTSILFLIFFTANAVSVSAAFAALENSNVTDN